MPKPLSSSDSLLNILVVTAMYPHAGNEGYGAFVQHQVEQLRALGHSVTVVQFKGYESKTAYIRAALRVFMETRRRRYSVVHAHYGLTGLAALFRNSTPLVVTIHGSDALVGWLQPFVTGMICRQADATIVVSRNIARRLAGHFIPCGVDLSVFQPKPKMEARARLGLAPDRKYVLFPFNANRAVKRYDLVRAAVDRLTKEGRDIELLTVWNVPSHEMPWYYSAADVMVLCSDSEGSPTSVKEALACNLPLVSVDVGDVREIVQGVSRVELVERTIDGLVAGLKRSLDSVPQDMNGHQAMQRYSQEQTVTSIVRVYRNVMEQHDSSSLDCKTGERSALG